MDSINETNTPISITQILGHTFPLLTTNNTTTLQTCAPLSSINLEKETVTVQTEKPSLIIIYDIASREILKQRFTSSTTLNTANFSKGIYFYEVRNGNGVIKKGKVVKE